MAAAFNSQFSWDEYLSRPDNKYTSVSLMSYEQVLNSLGPTLSTCSCYQCQTGLPVRPSDPAIIHDRVEESLDGWRNGKADLEMCPDKVLDSAADVLEREGWIKGSLHRNYAHCAVGAIQRAAQLADPLGHAIHPSLTAEEVARRNDSFNTAKHALDQAISYTGHRAVESWNDSRETTKEEVVTTMRETAKVLRSKYPRKPKGD